MPVIYALAAATLLVFHETMKPGYCSPGAIGYMREVESGFVIAGGEIKSLRVEGRGYDLTAWFPSKNPVVMLTIWSGDDITTFAEE